VEINSWLLQRLLYTVQSFVDRPGLWVVLLPKVPIEWWHFCCEILNFLRRGKAHFLNLDFRQYFYRLSYSRTRLKRARTRHAKKALIRLLGLDTGEVKQGFLHQVLHPAWVFLLEPKDEIETWAVGDYSSLPCLFETANQGTLTAVEGSVLLAS